MILDTWFDLDQRAKARGSEHSKKRFIFDSLSPISGKHFVGLVGPRGSGKTILLEQLAASKPNSFYLSADTLQEERLFEIAKTLSETYSVAHLFIDEIHFQKNFEGELKKIFDFLKIQITFTSSVALAMHESSYDLARRVQLHTLFPFSYREYLYFTQNLTLPLLTLDELIKNYGSSEHLRQAHHFDTYLKGGLFPFALEEPKPLPVLENILKTVLHRDIPAIAKLTTDEIPILEKMVRFIATSGVDGISYSNLSQNLGITKYKAEIYVRLLEKSFILNLLMPAGANVLKEPKILMSPPLRLLYGESANSRGGLREDYFAQTLRALGQKVFYLKSTRGEKTPDFLIETQEGPLVIEVGGKGKGRSQFKGIKTTKKMILADSTSPIQGKCPLFMLGFLY